MFIDDENVAGKFYATYGDVEAYAMRYIKNAPACITNAVSEYNKADLKGRSATPQGACYNKVQISNYIAKVTIKMHNFTLSLSEFDCLEKQLSEVDIAAYPNAGDAIKEKIKILKKSFHNFKIYQDYAAKNE